MGAMGTFEVSGADGTYIILVVREAASIIKDETRNGHSQQGTFPIGAMGNFQGFCGTHPPLLVNRSVCIGASMSRGKRVSNFPIGAMGNVEREHALRTLCCQ